MPKILTERERLSEGLAIRLPKPWLDQIQYLRELQGISLSQQLRELIQVGAEQVGLDLDDQ